MIAIHPQGFQVARKTVLFNKMKLTLILKIALQANNKNQNSKED